MGQNESGKVVECEIGTQIIIEEFAKIGHSQRSDNWSLMRK